MAFIGAFLIQVAMMGASTGAFVMSIAPAAEAIGRTPADVGLWFTFITGFGAFTAIFLVARFISKFGIRGTILIGCVVASLGMVLVTFAKGLPLMYVGASMFGFGMHTTGTPMAQLVVAKWFFTGRGTLNGIIGLGEPVGTTILSAVAVAFAGSASGYKELLWVSAAIILACGLIAGLFLVKGVPEDFDLLPLGAKSKEEMGGDGDDVPGMSVSEIYRSPSFWLILIGIVVLTLGYYLTNPQLATYAGTVGFTTATAAVFVSTASWTKALIKVIYGAVGDKVGFRIPFAACTILTMLGVLVLSRGSSYGALIVGAIGIGIAGGLCGGGTLILSKMFGAKDLTKISPVSHGFNGIGGIIGPILFRFIFGRTNSYPGTFVFAIIFFAIYLVIIVTQLRPSNMYEKK